jgi:hypothetical protein
LLAAVVLEEKFKANPAYASPVPFVNVPVYVVVAVPLGPDVPVAAATDVTVLVPVNTVKLWTPCKSCVLKELQTACEIAIYVTS